MTYRLVRNVPAERYIHGRPEPFAPRYDVEEIDAARIPIRTHGSAMQAEAATALLARLEAQAHRDVAHRPPCRQ